MTPERAEQEWQVEISSRGRCMERVGGSGRVCRIAGLGRGCRARRPVACRAMQNHGQHARVPTPVQAVRLTSRIGDKRARGRGASPGLLHDGLRECRCAARLALWRWDGSDRCALHLSLPGRRLRREVERTGRHCLFRLAGNGRWAASPARSSRTSRTDRTRHARFRPANAWYGSEFIQSLSKIRRTSPARGNPPADPCPQMASSSTTTRTPAFETPRKKLARSRSQSTRSARRSSTTSFSDTRSTATRCSRSGMSAVRCASAWADARAAGRRVAGFAGCRLAPWRVPPGGRPRPARPAVPAPGRSSGARLFLRLNMQRNSGAGSWRLWLPPPSLRPGCVRLGGPA